MVTELIRVMLNCHVCHGLAGIGLNVEEATHNVTESGGRIFGGYLLTCSRCARGTH